LWSDNRAAAASVSRRERREPLLLVQCSDHRSADGADVGLRCPRHGRETAIQKYNRHMEECNRVIESQLSGRASPTALEATDARNELTRLRGELDTVDSDRKVLKAKLDDKERLIDELSVRLDALEKAGQTGSSIQPRNGSGTPGPNETERKLIARINQLTEQLEAEKQKNRTLKGA